MNSRFPTAQEWIERCNPYRVYNAVRKKIRERIYKSEEAWYFGPSEIKWDDDSRAMPMQVVKDEQGEIVGFSMQNTMGIRDSERPRLIK